MECSVEPPGQGSLAGSAEPTHQVDGNYPEALQCSRNECGEVTWEAASAKGLGGAAGLLPGAAAMGTTAWSDEHLLDFKMKQKEKWSCRVFVLFPMICFIFILSLLPGCSGEQSESNLKSKPWEIWTSGRSCWAIIYSLISCKSSSAAPWPCWILTSLPSGLGFGFVFLCPLLAVVSLCMP